MTSQPGQRKIALYIFPSISRSKGIQTMKFDQLIEYNTRNIFLEKSYINYMLENNYVFPDPIVKSQN